MSHWHLERMPWQSTENGEKAGESAQANLLLNAGWKIGINHFFCHWFQFLFLNHLALRIRKTLSSHFWFLRSVLFSYISFYILQHHLIYIWNSHAYIVIKNKHQFPNINLKFIEAYIFYVLKHNIFCNWPSSLLFYIYNNYWLLYSYFFPSLNF